MGIEKKFEGVARFYPVVSRGDFPLHGFINNKIFSTRFWEVEVYDDKNKGKHIVPFLETKENEEIFHKLWVQAISGKVYVKGKAEEEKYKGVDTVRYQGTIKSENINYEFDVRAYNLPNFPVMKSSIS